LGGSHPSHELTFVNPSEFQMKLNGNREVIGLLRGFDPFMNIVLEECMEVTKSGQQVGIDTVVVRGNSVNVVEILERV
uniref:Sm protein G n=1 Tax=Schistocephalus solidus TaxID=70667 RepID=A0A183T641_SCHSO